jgi:hypothetical protein
MRSFTVCISPMFIRVIKSQTVIPERRVARMGEKKNANAVEPGYNVMKGTEYFVSL